LTLSVRRATIVTGFAGAFYEMRYLPIARALRKAVDDGADVKIVYDNESSYKEENTATLQRADLLYSDISTPRTVTEGIRHNNSLYS